ncbi:MAG: hypothetical protein WB567_02230, partial [Terracidiphilus sp.]
FFIAPSSLMQRFRYYSSGRSLQAKLDVQKTRNAGVATSLKPPCYKGHDVERLIGTRCYGSHNNVGLGSG